MKVTNLQVQKIGRNKFYLDCEVLSLCRLMKKVDRYEEYFSSREELVERLSYVTNRSVQRVVSSTSYLRRLRAAKLDSVVLSVRWDGCEKGRRPAYSAIFAYVELDLSRVQWEKLPWSFANGDNDSAESSGRGDK
jgi:hypothetical protein